MTPHEKTAVIYAKLHATRYEPIEQARRARTMQAEIYDLRRLLMKSSARDKALVFFVIVAFGALLANVIH